MALKNITERTYETVIEYRLVFDDGHYNGFAFPCDKDGQLKNICPEALKNYKFCLDNPEAFKRYNKVIKEEYHLPVFAHGTCSCGNEVELVEEFHGACSCEKCGQWYNLFGQEILPPYQWKEDLDNDY